MYDVQAVYPNLAGFTRVIEIVFDLIQICYTEVRGRLGFDESVSVKMTNGDGRSKINKKDIQCECGINMRMWKNVDTGDVLDIP